jgi:short-subunit dehydrogenase
MKNIVITGSTRGIGFEMAKEFLRNQCHVTLSGRGQNLSDEVVKQLENFIGNYIYISCDVSNERNVQTLWDESIKKWGTIDIWINNAGQNSQHAFSWEINHSDMKSVINTNLIGMIYGSQIAAREMIKQGFGSIYSMEGLGSNNMIQSKTIHYGTTKHALTYYMKGLAKELKGTNVLAGRLSPGMMLTEFITKNSNGQDSEVISDERFIKIFNILADKPETVAHFFIPRILENKKNNVQIIWLTNWKIVVRFIFASFSKNRLIGNS